ncbi:MAG: choice-of-anchor D domain-containing protein [bacterium]
MHHITDSAYLTPLAQLYGQVIQLTDSDINQYPKGPKVVSDGLICKEETPGEIYLIQNVKKRHFVDEPSFTSRGYELSGGDPISPTFIILKDGMLSSPVSFPQGVGITTSGATVNCQLYFEKNGQPTSTFYVGDWKDAYFNVMVGDGYTVVPYLKLTAPDGSTHWGYYSGNRNTIPESPEDFSVQGTKTPLINGFMNLKVFNYHFNHYQHNSPSNGTWTWELYLEDANKLNKSEAERRLAYASATYEVLDQPTNVIISVDPNSWNYGSFTVGQSLDKVFTITNSASSTGTLNVTGQSLIGTNASEFSIVSGGGTFSLAPGQSHQTTVRFAPSTAGSKTATLRITNNSNNAPTKEVPLSGTGVELAPVLSVTPTILNFGTSTTQMSFNISNSGGGTLSWNVSKAATWITSVSPSSGMNSGTVTVTVSRSGLQPGNYQGTVSVSSNGGNQDVTVSMDVSGAGNVIFADDFNRSTIGSNWQIEPANESVSIVGYPPDGKLQLYNPDASGTHTYAWIVATGTTLKDVILTFDFDNGPEQRQNNATSIYLRYIDAGNHYRIDISEDNYQAPSRQKVFLYKTVAGIGYLLEQRDAQLLEPGRYEFSAVGNQVTFKNISGGTNINIQVTDNVVNWSGKVGFKVN